MPTVKDKTTGDVVSQQPYTSEGTQRAKQIADTDPNWELSYAPNGKTDGATRSQQMYAGGGKTGYNEIGIYKKGGRVVGRDVDDYSHLSIPDKEKTKEERDADFDAKVRARRQRLVESGYYTQEEADDKNRNMRRKPKEKTKKEKRQEKRRQRRQSRKNK